MITINAMKEDGLVHEVYSTSRVRTLRLASAFLILYFLGALILDIATP